MGRGDLIYYGGLDVAGSDGRGGLLGQKRVKGSAGDSLPVTGTNLDGAAAASVGVIMTNTWGTATAADRVRRGPACDSGDALHDDTATSLYIAGGAKPGHLTLTKAPPHRFCGGAFAHPGASAGTLHTLGLAVVL